MAERDDDALEDWRLYAYIKILGVRTTDTALKTRPGDFVKIIANIKYNDLILKVGIPSAPALYLNKSHEMYEKAVQLLHKSVLQAQADKALYVPDQIVFDFFQEIMGSTILAFAAIESFANEQIPDLFLHEKKRKRIWAVLSKESIERYESLDTKLKVILPKILKTKGLDTAGIWKDYSKLKEIRDRLVHLKDEDRRALADELHSIWHVLFDSSLISPPFVAKEVIRFFLESSKHKPRWYEKIPF